MWYCPNCDKQLESDAVADCPFCYASFGEGSSWKPMSILPTRRRNGATVVLLFAALGPIAGAVISSLWIFLMTAGMTLHQLVADPAAWAWSNLMLLVSFFGLGLLGAHVFGGLAAVAVGVVYVMLRGRSMSRGMHLSILAMVGGLAEAVFLQFTAMRAAPLPLVGVAALTAALFAVWATRAPKEGLSGVY